MFCVNSIPAIFHYEIIVGLLYWQQLLTAAVKLIVTIVVCKRLTGNACNRRSAIPKHLKQNTAKHVTVL